jgi:hypothetical protein
MPSAEFSPQDDDVAALLRASSRDALVPTTTTCRGADGQADGERRGSITRRRLAVTVSLLSLGLVLLFGPRAPQRHASFGSSRSVRGTVGLQEKVASSREATVALFGSDPNWGCGLVGSIPGITQNGSTAAETQRLIDGIKGSSTFNKVSYWNWNLAPMTDGGTEQHLSSDFIFMPEQWGATAVEGKYLRKAGEANYLDSNGKVTPSEMATVLLGMNEPDIRGSCMGNMFGKCTAPCPPQAAAAGDCPAANLDTSLGEASPNSRGECNCWQFSHATGVGFWPLQGCAGNQPLVNLWQDTQCVSTVMQNWKQTAATAVKMGYKYLTTPLVAVDLGYATKFIDAACGCTSPGQCTCTEASCGCPVYIGFHFYAFDCRPSAGGYKGFEERLRNVSHIMEQYPFVKGAIVNEVGMLNCRPTAEEPVCVPDSGKYPASEGPDGSCPPNEELPNGMASYISRLFDYVIAAKTSDNRDVVKGFSWFNENKAGGTYNLQLFDETGKVNAAGEAYMEGCSRWAQAQKQGPLIGTAIFKK